MIAAYRGSGPESGVWPGLGLKGLLDWDSRIRWPTGRPGSGSAGRWAAQDRRAAQDLDLGW